MLFRLALLALLLLAVLWIVRALVHRRTVSVERERGQRGADGSRLRTTGDHPHAGASPRRILSPKYTVLLDLGALENGPELHDVHDLDKGR